jgi:hypothetical protein
MTIRNNPLINILSSCHSKTQKIPPLWNYTENVNRVLDVPWHCWICAHFALNNNYSLLRSINHWQICSGKIVFEYNWQWLQVKLTNHTCNRHLIVLVDINHITSWSQPWQHLFSFKTYNLIKYNKLLCLIFFFWWC